MPFLGKGLLLLGCLVACAISVPQYVHMLQLNSYRPERYRRWRRENIGKCLSVGRWLPALALLGAVFVPLTWWQAAVGGAVLTAGALLSLPPKAKKPLVYTQRVRRLLVTLAVLHAAVCAAALWCPLRYTLIPTALLYVAVPWTVALAAAVNAPVEKKIADGFVRQAAQKLAAMPELLIIGITGSYGKTSTKYFLHELLAAHYNVQMTPESYNTLMGVVRTVREQLRPSAQIFLVEMGAKNRGDIREICDLVHPRMGVITSVGEQHLETFGSLQNIIDTKFELADALPADGKLFLNGDNALIRERAVSVPAVYYGAEAPVPGGYYADDVTVDLQGSSFTLHTPDGESRRFTTRLLGGHNIQNLVGCIAVAHQLQIPLEELVYPVRRLKPVPHRLQLLPGGYIDDAYNSNPAGFRSALRVLKSFTAQRILVTPGMVELGDRQEALNRELGAFAADCCDIAVLVGEKQAPPLRQGLLEAGKDPSCIHVAPTLQDALQYIRALPPVPDRIVLLENDLPDNF